MHNSPLFLVISGSFPREVGPNIPVLNIPVSDNWPHMSAGSHSMLSSNTSSPQGQYGVWMSGPVGNLSPNQSCAMPYLRTSAPYTLPTTSAVTTGSAPTLSGSQPSFDHPCDIGSFAAPSRESGRSNWSPLTPPPI